MSQTLIFFKCSNECLQHTRVMYGSKYACQWCIELDPVITVSITGLGSEWWGPDNLLYHVFLTAVTVTVMDAYFD